ncbi:MAG: hypothetical protein IJZ88_04570 [Clostridia bacterium]|nr:hypothetical protein [Clostridia bacterium]
MKSKKFRNGILIFFAVIFAWIVGVLWLFSPFIEIVDGPFLEEGKIYHTTDIEDLKLNGPLLSVPIEAIDCSYSLQREGFWQEDGVYPLTGMFTLTEENYQTILNKYDDWQELTGFPPVVMDYYTKDFAEGITEFGDEKFEDCWKNKTYLYSEKLVYEELIVCLVSPDEPVIYFYCS